MARSGWKIAKCKSCLFFKFPVFTFNQSVVGALKCLQFCDCKQKKPKHNRAEGWGMEEHKYVLLHYLLEWSIKWFLSLLNYSLTNNSQGNLTFLEMVLLSSSLCWLLQENQHSNLKLWKFDHSIGAVGKWSHHTKFRITYSVQYYIHYILKGRVHAKQRQKAFLWNIVADTKA